MRRLLRSESYLGALLLAVFAAVASGAVYQWSGAATNDDKYTEPVNWCTSFPCGSTYPDDSGDDALFPVVAGGVGNVWGDVDLDFNGSLTIDNMTIKDSLDFQGHTGSPPALTVASLTIDATNAAITIKFNEHLGLTAH